MTGGWQSSVTVKALPGACPKVLNEYAETAIPVMKASSPKQSNGKSILNMDLDFWTNFGLITYNKQHYGIQVGHLTETLFTRTTKGLQRLGHKKKQLEFTCWRTRQTVFTLSAAAGKDQQMILCLDS